MKLLCRIGLHDWGTEAKTTYDFGAIKVGQLKKECWRCRSMIIRYPDDEFVEPLYPKRTVVDVSDKSIEQIATAVANKIPLQDFEYMLNWEKGSR